MKFYKWYVSLGGNPFFTVEEIDKVAQTFWNDNKRQVRNNNNPRRSIQS